MKKIKFELLNLLAKILLFFGLILKDFGIKVEKHSFKFANNKICTDDDACIINSATFFYKNGDGRALRDFATGMGDKKLYVMRPRMGFEGNNHPDNADPNWYTKYANSKFYNKLKDIGDGIRKEEQERTNDFFAKRLAGLKEGFSELELQSVEEDQKRISSAEERVKIPGSPYSRSHEFFCTIKNCSICAEEKQNWEEPKICRN